MTTMHRFYIPFLLAGMIITVRLLDFETELFIKYVSRGHPTRFGASGRSVAVHHSSDSILTVCRRRICNVSRTATTPTHVTTSCTSSRCGRLSRCSVRVFACSLQLTFPILTSLMCASSIYCNCVDWSNITTSRSSSSARTSRRNVLYVLGLRIASLPLTSQFSLFCG